MGTAIYQGVDFSAARPTVQVLRNNGKTFVLRYLAPENDQTRWKLLTRPEADAYRAAGIQVVSNFEWYEGRPLEGRDAGVADARVAASQHGLCGGPPDRPIYFSVDRDVNAGQFAAITAYFQGVASVIGLHRTGVYGEFDLVKYLMDHNLVGRSADGSHFYAWQCYAWSGGRYDERCALAQDKNGVRLANAYDVDLDSAHAEDYGQWDYKGDTSVATIDEVFAKLQAYIDEWEVLRNRLTDKAAFDLAVGRDELGAVRADLLKAVQAATAASADQIAAQGRKIDALAAQVSALAARAGVPTG